MTSVSQPNNIAQKTAPPITRPNANAADRPMRGWAVFQAGASMTPAPNTTEPNTKMINSGMDIFFID